MIQNIDPVFGTWYTQNQIGSGADGKVFSIKRENRDGSDDISSLKIIRIGENKSERKSVYQQNTDFSSENDYFEKTITSITDNIDIVMKTDAGKYFVNYEEYETRKASDGKGWLILIRLERMKSLSELLEEFSFTHNEVVRLGISICQSLIKCRTFGYIYPNLKPENVLFDKNSVCKLGDFGTFSLLEPSRAAIAYKRTQYYMAPEFIKSAKVNCTIDTYSLGLILYMLVNRNRLPFVNPYPENITIHSLNQSTQNRLDAVPLPKPALASDELFEIINKACNPKENKRYLSPKQMLLDLKKLVKTDYEADNYNETEAEEKSDDIEEIQQNLKDEAQIPFVSTEQNIQQLYSDEKQEQLTNQKTESEINPEKVKPEPKEPEKKEEVFLKNEIGIPDISPDTYHVLKQRKEKANSYTKLPEVKKEVKVTYHDKKKILVLIFIAIFFLSLFVISLSLYSYSKANESELLLIFQNTLYNKYERYGVLQWLMN